MTQEQLLILAILTATVGMFLWGRWRHDMVAAGALLACVLAGLVAPAEAFSGFGHPAVVTVACVLVLSRGLQSSGAVDVLAARLLPAKAGMVASLAALVGLGALLSGFMNNVGAMALLMPVAMQLAGRLSLPPGRVLMLGAGGVGLAIAFGLQTLKASELVLYDTNPDLTRSLIAALDQSKMVVREAEADLATEMKAADGLINATPIGMYQYPGNPFPESGFGQQRWAFDAVYTPENTAFMNLCRKQNIATLSGFQLFLYQGLDAFRHFTGLEADARLIEREFLKRYPLNC